MVTVGRVQVPAGNSVVYLKVTRKSNPTAVIRLSRGTRDIAARVIRPADFFTGIQSFGLVVTTARPMNLDVSFKLVSGDATPGKAFVGKSHINRHVLCPWLGNRAHHSWYQVRAPKAVRSVWIDPRFDKIRHNGQSQYEHVRQALYCIGRVCGLAFKPSKRDLASVVFLSRPAEEVERLSRQWNSMEWFGSMKYASCYIAISPNDKIYIGDRQKDWMGGGPLSPINTTRFALNAFLQSFPFGKYHADDAPAWAAANANFSAPIIFPSNNNGHNSGGLAGMDRYEIRHLQALFGPPWLGKVG